MFLADDIAQLFFLGRAGGWKVVAVSYWSVMGDSERGVHLLTMVVYIYIYIYTYLGVWNLLDVIEFSDFCARFLEELYSFGKCDDGDVIRVLGHDEWFTLVLGSYSFSLLAVSLF